jgi:hypothetical protein
MIAPRPQPAADAPPALRVAGHFGEFLQGRMGPDGPVAVVSAPCPALVLEGRLDPGAGDLPPGGAVLLAALGLDAPPGRVVLSPAMPPGGGAGSSTAALVALARLAGFRGPPQVLAAACVAAEGASDPLMYPAPERVLFASRTGAVLADLPALPPMQVVGGFWGPDRATDAADHDFPDIADLVAGWQRGGGLPHLAALATESARRTLALRGPAGDPTGALAQGLGALGWLIAHTGSARGLIFAPGAVPPGAEAALAGAGFRQVIRFGVGG